MARLISYDYIRQKALADPDSGEAVVYLQDIAEAPTVDAVEVVRCRDCEIHGNCATEDVFSFAGISNPFCCAGKRKEGDRNE